ncbi:MAG TPA: protein kinase [Thermoanaerobaculia bacterium]|nr:protein kinase [Thermoanaerobaculia bacterium]
MSEDGRDAETLSGSQASTVPASARVRSSVAPVTVFRPSLPLGGKFGSYRLRKLLGKGGMGEVYEAEQEETGRRVALKVLSPAVSEATDRARFLREGRLAASVSHPNSVYVFGTEEIEGTAAIAMELVPGGTLKDRVERDGPMPPGEAVDAILQVVEGLEAAASRGILHRDIKPSNCFVSEGGGVKIGDYGLSLSTSSGVESHLTQSGTFLGTPAFASPEQVRGGAIDVRSDIYSVGATLYYLVTGRAPFEGGGVGALLSNVLECAPEPARTLRPEVPPGLDRLILRCLRKQPSLRFAGYAALSEELRPFASSAPAPASLGTRLGAAVLDWCLLSLPEFFAGAVHGLESQANPAVLPPRDSGTFDYLFIAAALSYFTLLEGLSGASLGKRLLGLRVRRLDGGLPGWKPGFVRSAIWVAFSCLVPPAVSLLLWHTIHPRSGVPHTVRHVLDLGSFLLLFVTARRANGFAGLHDLASGTRVVRYAAALAKAASPSGEWAARVDPAPAHFGPYAVLERLSESPGESLLLGADERLRRRVWIHRLTPGSPAVSAIRRELDRPTRPRWLNGRRSAAEAWDVYEATEGCPFSVAVGRAPDWQAQRFWILDVAEELAAGARDGTLPRAVGPASVWITAEGRARILDFPVPAASGSTPEPPETPAALLRRVCLAAARGPIPVYASSLLNSLDRAADPVPEEVAQQLRAMLAKPPVVSSRRRVCHLVLCGLLVSFFSAVTLGVIGLRRGANSLELASFVLGISAAAGLAAAFLSDGGGFLLGLFGIGVVRRDGAPASVFRRSLRSLVGWSPYWALALGASLASRGGASFKDFRGPVVAVAIFVPVVAATVLWDAWAHPERGFQDRVAGTFLVPR